MASALDRIADALERMAVALETDAAADRFMTELLGSGAGPEPSTGEESYLADWYISGGVPWIGKSDAARPLVEGERRAIGWNGGR